MNSRSPAHRRWISSSRSATRPPARRARYGPGMPMSAHWGLPDPAAVEGSDEVKRQAFRDAAVTISRRIELMLALPLAGLEEMCHPEAPQRHRPALTRGMTDKTTPEAAGRGIGHCAAAGRGHRLGHHGRATRRRKCRHRPAGEHAGDRGRPLHPHRGVRPDQRCALQSRRVPGHGVARVAAAQPAARLRGRPSWAARCSAHGSPMPCST